MRHLEPADVSMPVTVRECPVEVRLAGGAGGLSPRRVDRVWHIGSAVRMWAGGLSDDIWNAYAPD